MHQVPTIQGSFIDFSQNNKTEPASASDVCEKLIRMINEFDSKLDQEHQVGMRLVSFGSGLTFHVTHLGYSNPSLISFHGMLDNGSYVELIQHVSQISFLLMAVKRINPVEPKKPIGFFNKESEEKTEQG